MEEEVVEQTILTFLEGCEDINVVKANVGVLAAMIIIDLNKLVL